MEKNEAKADLAKLEEAEKLMGFTLIMEMDQFQGGAVGRIVEVGPDGKQRWDMKNLAYPVDALVIPGNRVIVAELNTNRVTEREIATGKEIWGQTIFQPINLQRLSNGHIVAVGRNQIIELDRNHKLVATINRPAGDIVAGTKLRNGNFLAVTNQGVMITHDKDGKVVKTITGPRPNYYSTVQQLHNGKLLITQARNVVEVDPESGKIESQVAVISPSCAQKLPNGNILVASQNNFAQPVYEINPKGEIGWKYTGTDPTGQFRAWKARRH